MGSENRWQKGGELRFNPSAVVHPPTLPFLFLAGEAALCGESHSYEVGCSPGEVRVAQPGKGLPRAVTVPVDKRGQAAKGREVTTHLAPRHTGVGC